MPKHIGNWNAPIPNPVATPVVLLGFGEWSRANWFPILAELARWGVIDLTVVERREYLAEQTELQTLEQNGVLRRLAWEDRAETDIAARWRIAYIVTGAATHQHVIQELLKQCPGLKVIICEKPCGDGLGQALDIFDCCSQRGVALFVADHYLLRPGIQYLLTHSELLGLIGRPVRIIAKLNEAKDGGPSQGVIADLLIHLLNVLLVLFPGANFTPDVAYTAQALNISDTEQETYTLAIGSLTMPDGYTADCELEGGKQLVSDNKSIVLIGSEGCLEVDLIHNTLVLRSKNRTEVIQPCKTPWSYARLILKSLSLV
jgi:predicted dehydrogenase